MENSDIKSNFHEPLVLLESKYNYFLSMANTVKSQTLRMYISNKEIKFFLKGKFLLHN